jgi:hypothetical protein
MALQRKTDRETNKLMITIDNRIGSDNSKEEDPMCNKNQNHTTEKNQTNTKNQQLTTLKNPMDNENQDETVVKNPLDKHQTI